MIEKEMEFGIGELIRKIQNELICSEKERIESGQNPLFQTESCEVEIKCVLKQDNNTAGKINLQLLTMNMGKKVVGELVHTIKVKFNINNQKIMDNEDFNSSEILGRHPRYE